MKKNVLIFGLILGAILTGNALYMVNVVYDNPDFEGNDVVGYAAMIVVFSLTFFGIRNYRNKELGGVISLGKAFQTGAMIALLASTMYVGVWLFYYYLVMPDFVDKYSIHVVRMVEKHGGSVADIAAKQQEMEMFKENYRNPAFVVLISYAEVLPIGLVVAFVSSLILRRKVKEEVAKFTA
jgi:hypothetical protein